MSKPGKPALNTVRNSHAKRIRVGSQSKYSAKPPQTPAIHLSSLLRCNLFPVAIIYNNVLLFYYLTHVDT